MCQRGRLPGVGKSYTRKTELRVKQCALFQLTLFNYTYQHSVGIVEWHTEDT